MVLFYILQKYALNNGCTFLQSQLPSFQGSKECAAIIIPASQFCVIATLLLLIPGNWKVRRWDDFQLLETHMNFPENLPV
jgi:hypothetical protein